jgi:hypothetical protein
LIKVEWHLHANRIELNMMLKLAVKGIDTVEANRLKGGGLDANGLPAIVKRAEGLANPCRHCLQLIAEGDDKLVLAYRPFEGLQPYAEVGPIFLHRRTCSRYEDHVLPAWFAHLQPALVLGYGHDDWMRYERGGVVQGMQLGDLCRATLGDPEVSYVHIRSRYGCFQCRVERA